MKHLIILCSTLVILFTACQKGELPVSKADRGTCVTTMLDLGTNYKNQIWYKLKGNRVVNMNSRNDWDLAFESGEKGNHVLLNSAKLMFAVNTYKQNFANVSINDTIGFSTKKQPDDVSVLNASVIGIFENSNSNVFIIDLGVDENNFPIGLKKLQLVENTSTKFKLKFSNLDGSEFHLTEFSKDNTYNYLHFSLLQNTLQTSVGAPKESYDLEFTQYTHVFDTSGQLLPYLVQGVIINSNKVEVSKISGKTFESVNIKDTLQYPLVSKPDIIGYDWKIYNFSTGIYSIAPYSYIIRDTEGYFYKLRFVDFYNGSIKGYPKIEVQKL